ncbi:MAG: chromate resistance protein [Pseudomonadota bacterium]
MIGLVPGRATEDRWLALIAHLPQDAANTRMAMLRTLETLGAAALREGVYLLPDTPEHRHSLQELARYLLDAEASCEVVVLESTDAEQTARLRALFDRTARYTELLEILRGLESGIGIADPTALGRVLAKQRRELARIRALDFYGSPLAQQTEERLVELEQRVRKLIFPDHTEAPLRRQQRYFRRTWATRRPLLADRLASAWLIRRFIDPEATLRWLDPGEEAPADAVGFGFEGAPFCNGRSRVTFETLLAHFHRDNDPALARIGMLVRAIDIGDRRMAEAEGVETLLNGARRRATNDDELLQECEKTFDLLYEAYLDGLPRRPERL